MIRALFRFWCYLALLSCLWSWWWVRWYMEQNPGMTIQPPVCQVCP